MIDSCFFSFLTDRHISKGNFHIYCRLDFISVFVIECNINRHNIYDLFALCRYLIFYSSNNRICRYRNSLHRGSFRERSFRCIYSYNCITCSLGKGLSGHSHFRFTLRLRFRLGFHLSFCFSFNLSLYFCFRLSLNFALNFGLGFNLCLRLGLLLSANPLCGDAHDSLVCLDTLDDVLILIFGGSGIDGAVHQHRGYLISICGNHREYNLAIQSFSGSIRHICAVHQHRCPHTGLEGYRISNLAVFFRVLFLISSILRKFLVCNSDDSVLCHICDPVFIDILRFGNVHLIRSDILHCISLTGNHSKGKRIILLYFFIIGSNHIRCHSIGFILNLKFAVICGMGIKGHPVNDILFLSLIRTGFLLSFFLCIVLFLGLCIRLVRL